MPIVPYPQPTSSTLVLLDKFSTVYELLNEDWDGTDAVANLNDLNTVYNAVSELLIKLENSLSHS